MFDVVMVFEVIEHLTHQKKIMEGIRSRLKPNGVFIGSVPIQPNHAPEQHISPFKTMKSASDRLGVHIFDQKTIPMRTAECRGVIRWQK